MISIFSMPFPSCLECVLLEVHGSENLVLVDIIDRAFYAVQEYVMVGDKRIYLDARNF